MTSRFDCWIDGLTACKSLSSEQASSEPTCIEMRSRVPLQHPTDSTSRDRPLFINRSCERFANFVCAGFSVSLVLATGRDTPNGRVGKKGSVTSVITSEPRAACPLEPNLPRAACLLGPVTTGRDAISILQGSHLVARLRGAVGYAQVS